MSSDEEEEFGTAGGGSTNPSNKTLDYSDDDNDGEGDGGNGTLFEDTDDEAPAGGDHDPDAYSKESLLKAMADLKDYLDPSLKFAESTISSWDKVEPQIFSNKMKLQKVGELIQHIVETPAEDLSLEYKAVISTAAVSACRVHKEADEPKQVQIFFKSADKSDKTKNLAKSVSNDWMKESLQALSTSSSTIREGQNMHIQIIRAGMTFIQSAYVIKAKKAIAALKSTQKVDWEGVVNKCQQLTVDKDLPQLKEVVEATKTHLDEIVNKGTKTAETNSTPVVKIEDQPVAREASLKDVNDAKRGSRMSKMRAKLLQPAPVSVKPPAPAPAPPDAPAMAIPRVSRPAPISSEPSEIKAPNEPVGDQEGPWYNAQNRDFKWPMPSPEHKVESQRQTSASSKDPSQAMSASRGSRQPNYGQYESSRASSHDVGETSGALGDQSSNNVNSSHDNQTGTQGGTVGQSMYGQASFSEGPSSQKNDFKNYQRNKRQPEQESVRGPGNNKRARHDDRNFGPPLDAGRGRGRGVSNAPAWMEQDGAPRGQRPPSHDAPPISNFRDGPRGMPPSNPRGNFDRGPPGGGRGRGVTNIPAWMENRDGVGSIGSHAPPSRDPHDAPPARLAPPPRYGGGPPPPVRGGGGRGRGVSNLPAWMENDAGPGRGPPPGEYKGAPPPRANGPSGGFSDQGPMGGGRGRGRGRGVSNLPAWMTEANRGNV